MDDFECGVVVGLSGVCGVCTVHTGGACGCVCLVCAVSSVFWVAQGVPCRRCAGVVHGLAFGLRAAAVAHTFVTVNHGRGVFFGTETKTKKVEVFSFKTRVGWSSVTATAWGWRGGACVRVGGACARPHVDQPKELP